VAAIARDAAGNSSTAASVSITVHNDTTAPTVAVTAPAASATVAGTVTIGATASDDVGVVGVQFTLDGVNVGTERTAAPYELTWNSTTVANGAHVVAAIARDAAGNSSTAASVSITVYNDTTAPTVTVTSPAEGAAVTGSVTLAATASDDVGVAGVEFTLDGVSLGAAVTAAPYALAWNTVGVANGPHVLAAVARDAAGNQRTASVNLIVTNLP
jgi:ribosomal protein L11